MQFKKGISLPMFSLLWRHNGCDSVPNRQPHDCLLNRLFRRRSNKTSKLRVNGLCAVNSPVTGEFPAQMARYAENVSVWWRHHVGSVSLTVGHTVQSQAMIPHSRVLSAQEYNCVAVSHTADDTNARPWLNIMMPPYLCRKFHCGDKTIIKSSYLGNGISYTGKMAPQMWRCRRKSRTQPSC